MAQSEFLRYVGDADLHDGTILDVTVPCSESEEADVSTASQPVQVRVRGASGRVLILEFHDVRALRSCRAAGMVIYSLSELRCDPPYRRFSFANWNEDDDAHLEIEARQFTIVRSN